MAEVADYLIRGECGWECRAHRWGAGIIEYELVGGTGLSARQHAQPWQRDRSPAGRWPGWQAEFWRDDYHQQVRRCDGPLVLPAEDMTAALDVLAGQLRAQVNSYGQPGNPVADFVHAAAERAVAAQDGP